MAAEYVKLAQDLHPRLLNFFRKYPPPQIVGTATTSRSIPSSEETSTITIAENTSSSDPNAGASTTTVTTAPSESEIAQSDTEAKAYRNPFLPFKNPRTGNWHGPAYSMRRQAEMFKLAEKYKVLPLMPLSPKHPEVREQKRIENGLRVQGTGVGRQVKGKAWERTMRARLEQRRLAMEGMPELIRQWKERGHGRGWKKWPK
ncbi:related to ribosomal 25, mitochondrial [Lecanosticta acicola]|uniref:Related to ribosomal 25, mitochondrial n=1 Tax=Lecanosticta acicola TaxID=111012 RepID=A0AAI8Z8S2_9PEZI|nr:related to ribosomal 25, mitochondrial [Lecanosticta acicola]